MSSARPYLCPPPEPLELVERRTVEGKPHDPANRGYNVVYHDGEANRCPGCGRSHWHIGRMTAECGFCGTALPLAATVDVVSGRRIDG